MASVLVVDDSPSIRQTIKITLGDAGYAITEAVDGQDGLEKASAEKFDLVLTDLNMPRMDGLGMIQALRAKPELAGMPILFLSTESDGAVKQQAKSAGATGWLTKPFDPEKLIKVVAKVLGK